MKERDIQRLTILSKIYKGLDINNCQYKNLLLNINNADFLYILELNSIDDIKQLKLKTK